MYSFLSTKEVIFFYWIKLDQMHFFLTFWQNLHTVALANPRRFQCCTLPYFCSSVSVREYYKNENWYMAIVYRNTLISKNKWIQKVLSCFSLQVINRTSHKSHIHICVNIKPLTKSRRYVHFYMLLCQRVIKGTLCNFSPKNIWNTNFYLNPLLYFN